VVSVPPAEVAEVRLLLREFAMGRDRWIAALCRRLGASRSDYDALEALDAHGPMTPGELGSLLSLTSGSVTALVGRLEDLGWARREPHPEDRRKVIVSLTQAAWQLGQDELSPYFDAVDGATDGLASDHRAVVKGYLTDLVGRITEAPHAPGRSSTE
jgi:DNA-binding MarR family transcriptional regulator